MSERARRWALVAASVAVALGVGEAALRLVAPQPLGDLALARHPDLLDAPIPDAAGEITLPGVYAYTYRHDGEGRRVVPGTAEGPEVLVLGDSFAYGMGVDDDETMAAALDARLDALGTPARVVNGAVAGKDPVYTLRLLQTRGADWTADLALYLFYPNDWPSGWYQTLFAVDGDSLRPATPSNPWQERRIAIAGHPGFRALKQRSHLVGLGWRAAVATFGENPPPNGDADTTAAPVPWSWDGAVAAMAPFMRALQAELERRGARVLVAYAPSASEVAHLRRGGDRTPEMVRFDALCQEVGLACHDLTQTLVTSPLAVGRLYFPEAHWRAEAHALAAAALADVVRDALCASDPGCEGASPTGATPGARP